VKVLPGTPKKAALPKKATGKSWKKPRGNLGKKVKAVENGIFNSTSRLYNSDRGHGGSTKPLYSS